MICKNCKKEGTGKFCSNCGTPLVKEYKVKEAIAEFEKERIEEEKKKEEQREENPYKKREERNQNMASSFKGNDRARRNTVKTKKGVKKKSKPKETDYSKNLKPSLRKRILKRKKKSLSMPSVTVATKTVKKTISRALQVISFLCMFGIALTLVLAFFDRKSKFGTISTMVLERNYPLEVFVICMGSMIAFACISMLWIASKRKFQKDERIKSFDTGRGIIPFLCFGIAVLVAPELLKILPTSHEIFEGIEGALQVLYDNTNMIGSLVVFGVVTCFIRKIMKI